MVFCRHVRSLPILPALPILPKCGMLQLPDKDQRCVGDVLLLSRKGQAGSSLNPSAPIWFSSYIPNRKSISYKAGVCGPASLACCGVRLVEPRLRSAHGCEKTRVVLHEHTMLLLSQTASKTINIYLVLIWRLTTKFLPLCLSIIFKCFKLVPHVISISPPIHLKQAWCYLA